MRELSNITTNLPLYEIDIVMNSFYCIFNHEFTFKTITEAVFSLFLTLTKI